MREVLKKLELEDKLLKELEIIGRIKRVRAGNTILNQESNNIEIPFVLMGLLKVYRLDRNGNEVLLYYLSEGETCAMSISCCLEGKKKDIQVIAEKDSQVLMVPNGYLDNWINKYPNFKRFIFASYQKRFDELLDNIDSLVFTNLEDRLWKYLLDTKQATGSYEILKTHGEIAKDLGTSRVVISRLLKKLELEERIQQHRNKIEIL